MSFLTISEKTVFFTLTQGSQEGEGADKGRVAEVGATYGNLSRYSFGKARYPFLWHLKGELTGGF